MLTMTRTGISFELKKPKRNKKGSALAGSRTRVYCLEGNNANRYTTNADTI